MTEIRFYHLTEKRPEAALPEILAKALGTGKRVVVKAADETMVSSLNEHLWTWRPDSFLPHGTARDGFAADQPIWLTAAEDNPNGAKILVLTGGATAETVDRYDLCCEILDGRQEEQVAAARDRWKSYKDAGHSVTYWKQNDGGGWEKKA